MKTSGLNTKFNETYINEAIDGFLFHCQFEKNLNLKTTHAYEIDLQQFNSYIEKTVEQKTIKSITKDVLKSYLQKISHFKPKTVKRKIASLKAMLNFIEYENERYINPFRKLKVKFKEPYILPFVMTLSEVKKILHIMYQELFNNKNKGQYTYKAQIRNITIVEMLFSTGLRVSEICNLNFSDINLKNGVIKVLGKGNKERIIQICQEEVLSIIKTYYQLHKESINKKGSFFINRIGQPLSTQSVRLMIKSYVKKAGLSKQITPHTFRHTFATLLLEEDVDIKYIQNMLGHSSISTTQIYTHVNMSKQKKILKTKHPRRKLQLIKE